MAIVVVSALVVVEGHAWLSAPEQGNLLTY